MKNFLNNILGPAILAFTGFGGMIYSLVNSIAGDSIEKHLWVIVLCLVAGLFGFSLLVKGVMDMNKVSE